MVKVNSQMQASLEQVEESLKQSINAYVPPERKPASTDPLPFDHHLELVDHAENAVQYISSEIEKYRDLLRIIENLQSHLNLQHAVLMQRDGTLPPPESKKKSRRWPYRALLATQLTSIVAAVGVVAYFILYK